MTRYFKFLGGHKPDDDRDSLQLTLNFGWGWTTFTEINRTINNGQDVRTYSLHRYEMSFFDFIRQHNDNEIHIYSIRFNGGVLYAHDRYQNPPFDPNNDIVEIKAIVI
jgi:hypothetical protein